jgi:hypothetical protein
LNQFLEGSLQRHIGASRVKSPKSRQILLNLIGRRSREFCDFCFVRFLSSLGWSICHMNDEQIASVLTYIRNTWGNGAAHVFPEADRKLRKAT